MSPILGQDKRDAIGAALTARAHALGDTEAFGDIVVPRARATTPPVDGASVHLSRAAEEALAARVRELRGDVLDVAARTAALTAVTVPTIGLQELDASLRDFAAGDGGKLRWNGVTPPKLHSAYSSAGLALNSFAPWRLDARSLVVGRHSGFSELRFEEKLPIFAARATGPNLDLLLLSAEQAVAVESKLTEFLVGRQRAAFSPRYAAAVAELAHPTWGAE